MEILGQCSSREIHFDGRDYLKYILHNYHTKNRTDVWILVDHVHVTLSDLICHIKMGLNLGIMIQIATINK